MIEWLLGGAGAFIKIVKFYVLLFIGVCVFGFAAIVTDYWCRILKRWLYARKRRITKREVDRNG